MKNYVDTYRTKTSCCGGIGHETDFTLLDFVSNIGAETPTAAVILSEGASKLKTIWILCGSLNKKIIF